MSDTPANKIIPPDFAAVPADLKFIPRWVLWRTEAVKGKGKGKGKLTKVPYQANGLRAQSTGAATWCSFDEARAAYDTGKFSGVGFVFNGDGIVGVDLDGVRDATTGDLTPLARDIVTRLDSYTEVSVSGTGLHVFLRGEKPSAACRRGVLEVYASGRYFTVTGRRLADTKGEIESRQDALTGLCEQFLGAKPNAGTSAPVAATTTACVSPEAAEALADTDLPVAKLDALLATDNIFRDSWARKRPDLADQSASTYDLSLGTLAAMAGWADCEIVALWVAWRTRYGEDTQKPRRSDYQRRTFDLIHKAVGGNDSAPPAPLAVLSSLLRVGITGVFQVGESDATWDVLLEDGRRIGLGTTSQVLSGGKPQARLTEALRRRVRFTAKAWVDVADALVAASAVVDAGSDGDDFAAFVETFCEACTCPGYVFSAEIPLTAHALLNADAFSLNGIPHMRPDALAKDIFHRCTGTHVDLPGVRRGLARLGWEPCHLSVRDGADVTTRRVWRRRTTETTG